MVWRIKRLQTCKMIDYNHFVRENETELPMSIVRQEQILEYMRDGNTFVTVEQLCGLLYISPATVRRDLSAMEASGVIHRLRGGALLIQGTADDDPMLLREQQNVTEKQIIAGRAVKHIHDGMTIFMDSSSTVYYLARILKGFKNLRVITNGIKTASCLADYDGITVMCTGGTVRPGTKSLVGAQTLSYISSLHADAAFISCRGFMAEDGAFEANEEEYHIKKRLLGNCEKAFLLCTKGKLGCKYLFHLGKVQDFDEIIIE